MAADLSNAARTRNKLNFETTYAEKRDEWRHTMQAVKAGNKTKVLKKSPGTERAAQFLPSK